MDPERVRTLHGALGFSGRHVDEESDVAVLDLRVGGLRQVDYITGVHGIFHMAQAHEDRYDADGGHLVIATLPSQLASLSRVQPECYRSCGESRSGDTSNRTFLNWQGEFSEEVDVCIPRGAVSSIRLGWRKQSHRWSIMTRRLSPPRKKRRKSQQTVNEQTRKTMNLSA